MLPVHSAFWIMAFSRASCQYRTTRLLVWSRSSNASAFVSLHRGILPQLSLLLPFDIIDRRPSPVLIRANRRSSSTCCLSAPSIDGGAKPSPDEGMDMSVITAKLRHGLACCVSPSWYAVAAPPLAACGLNQSAVVVFPIRVLLPGSFARCVWPQSIGGG